MAYCLRQTPNIPENVSARIQESFVEERRSNTGVKVGEQELSMRLNVAKLHAQSHARDVIWEDYTAAIRMLKYIDA